MIPLILHWYGGFNHSSWNSLFKILLIFSIGIKSLQNLDYLLDFRSYSGFDHFFLCFSVLDLDLCRTQIICSMILPDLRSQSGFDHFYLRIFVQDFVFSVSFKSPVEPKALYSPHRMLDLLVNQSIKLRVYKKFYNYLFMYDELLFSYFFSFFTFLFPGAF